ncbi:hypothetical protein GCM10025868_04740 [Angustibacter aerolatus]|uniref:Glycosyl hydrolase family 13 catalytic domain-containing protein n=1 Tax=Angustibacter aerolatus TaxID=1162965 RepID=A0ABQ6JCQ4_9ACTN|nr:hypothetical protein GCM10025868_04740 [Angustibacter aerolatus]
MPVHQFVQDPHLLANGLSNYWGYNTIGFLAPHNAYAAYGTRGQQVAEFKGMVKALHEADIEVILDVVYNHTAEGNQMGPTIAFRGIDNRAYYRLVDGDEAHYYDTTGTGNSLLMRHPHVLQAIMDSLRYWVTEMHVDGFRFDLASSLARQFHEVDRLSAFFDLVQQDPIVSQVKAHRRAVGRRRRRVPGGQLPPLWTEWNGKYRDTVRDFWRGDSATLGEFASRITGSSDLYEHSGRKPIASINFVVAHDGFTLRDLVSYNDKHNDANGEGNNDGESHNRSWNCGVEGETDDTEINALRLRQQRNLLTTLLLSQGVPMIAHGDEPGAPRAATTTSTARTTRSPGSTGTSTTTSRCCSRSPSDWWRCARSTRCSAVAGSSPARPTTAARASLGDIAWFTPAGEHMSAEDWTNGYARSLAVFCNGSAIPEPDRRGAPTTDDSFLVLFNGHHETLEFQAPDVQYGQTWQIVLDTSDGLEPQGEPEAAGHPRGAGSQRRRAAVREGRRVSTPHRPADGRPVPTGTYRLQVRAEFGFDDAAEQAGYLRDLGVSHAYLSPCCSRPPGRRTGTTWSTTAACTPRPVASPPSAGWSTRCTVPVSAPSSTSCRTTWRCRPPRR